MGNTGPSSKAYSGNADGSGDVCSGDVARTGFDGNQTGPNLEDSIQHSAESEPLAKLARLRELLAEADDAYRDGRYTVLQPHQIRGHIAELHRKARLLVRTASS